MKEEEQLELKKELEQKSFEHKELQMKFDLAQERLSKIDNDHKLSSKNNENLNKEIYQLQIANEKLKKEFE
jgi:hypothetical protein